MSAKLPSETARLTDEQKKFVDDNKGLLYKFAIHYWDDGNTDAKHVYDSVDDLANEAFFGMARAAQLFDPSRGFKFSTYAWYWMRQAVTRSIDNRRLVHIPTEKTKKVKCRVWTNAAIYGRDREIVLTSVAAKKKQKAKEYEAIDCEPAARPEDIDSRIDAQEACKELLRWLPARDREAFYLHFGEGVMIAELGERLGITGERARQIVSRSMEKVRKILGIPTSKTKRSVGKRKYTRTNRNADRCNQRIEKVRAAA